MQESDFFNESLGYIQSEILSTLPNERIVPGHYPQPNVIRGQRSGDIFFAELSREDIDETLENMSQEGMIIPMNVPSEFSIISSLPEYHFPNEYEIVLENGETIIASNFHIIERNRE